MKDFAKKHPINKSKAKRVKTSLRAKRELNQPLKLKHLLLIAAMSALLLFASNIRVSGNYLIDEFILDQEQINEKKASGRAYSYKIVYSPKISRNQILSLYFSKINIGTYTFRHQLGSNNFVQSGKPLGSILGSDCIENKAGIRYMASENFLITFNY